MHGQNHIKNEEIFYLKISVFVRIIRST